MYEPKEEKTKHDGIQKIYQFDNGYGASVIKNSISYGNSYGLWELAVIKFDNEGHYQLTYDTPITKDVIGYLTENEVQAILEKIEQL